MQICRTALLFPILAGCVASGPDADEPVAGEVSLLVAAPPSGIRCVHVVVSGASTLAKSFSVPAGASDVAFDFGLLAPGNTHFESKAYDADCPSPTTPPTAAPTWLADATDLKIIAGIRGRADLLFHRNTGTDGDALFEETAVEVALGKWTSYVLLGNGKVAWMGVNDVGQRGAGYTCGGCVGEQYGLVSGLAGVTRIGAGYKHACAVTDGILKCWGGNAQGAIGDNTTTNRTVPTATNAGWLPESIEITAGGTHTCVVHWNGIWNCWGGNASGQLGVGTTADRLMPLWVGIVNYFQPIGAGADHTCTTNADRRVFCTGKNDQGQLGDNTLINHSSFAQTSPALEGVIAADAGGASSCAVKGDGTAYCWGDNFYGQLGDASTTDRKQPVAVSGLTDAVDVKVGDDFACALRKGGTVRCWGSNDDGQLGNGSGTDSNVPVPVAGLTGIVSLDVGYDHACAIDGNGRLWCWGGNGGHQLGFDDQINRITPVRIPLPAL
jgi:alpha-tubulin suppressor-like RCC1 family protein